MQIMEEPPHHDGGGPPVPTHSNRSSAILAALVAACSSATFAVAEEAVDPLVRDLRAAGLEPSREAIAEFLERIRPSEERTRSIHEAVEKLDDRDYAVREAATRQLAGTARLPRELIESLAVDDDAEVRMRARRILRLAHFSTHRAQIVAILRYVKRERLEGFVPVLLDVMGEWTGEPYVSDLFVEAVAATTTPGDEPRLRTVLSNGVSTQRRSAVMALSVLLGEGFDRELEALLRDRDELVRLAAVTRLLERGSRDALSRLGELLDADGLEVRLRAVRTLRAATGQQFGYAPYDDENRRKAGAAKWRAWIDENLATAELRLPPELRENVELGRILIGLYGERKLREIDEQGNTLWEAGGFTYLWGCHALPNGHRLGVDYRQKYVVEFDAHGNRVWIAEDLPGNPTDVHRLEDGNTLLALAEPTGLVVEISPEKKIVWKQQLDGRPTTARRLPGGNTLVCLQFARRVVEIDPTGRVVWKIENLGRPHTAQRLENGNTLVCEMDPNGRVAEFDLDGKLVWEKKGISNPAQAQRLANGHTVYSCSTGIHVVDHAGNQVRHHQVSRSRFFAF